jgi:hypothetical protein
MLVPVVAHAGQRFDLPDEAHEGQAHELRGDQAAPESSFVVTEGLG